VQITVTVPRGAVASLIAIPFLAFDLFGFAYLANDFELTLAIRGALLGCIGFPIVMALMVKIT
jgi:hypothetical protein